MNKLLDRDTFRESVFKRDGHKCVICGNKVQDAHHIMERRLFMDGGYYIENGASVCGECHIKAEQTLISPQDFYDKLEIKERILPEDLYDEYNYTKWGDIILPKYRLKGPLFGDESVQKVLESGGVLNLYSRYIKYPRTFHLPWSESRTDDDRTLKSVDHFDNQQVVVTLKMDGESTSIYSDGYVHARSIDAESHWTQNYVRNLASKIGYELPSGWRICGENLYARHSISYNNLQDYFYGFSLWNEKNECLEVEETRDWFSLLSVKYVPIMYMGIFDENFIRELWRQHEDEHEGYVIRVADKFNYSQFKYKVAKFVRKNHVQTSNHWKFEKIEKNNLA